ncbi:MAG: DUF1616 domain-containing protein [Coriobacteriia bacterium]
MTRNRAIFLIATATAIAGVVLLLAEQGPVWLRVLFGLPFVLLLPGHALMLLVDPSERLGRAEWFALSLGASISITIFAGMALATTTFGLNASGMILLLTLLTLALSFAARAKTSAELLEEAPPARRNPELRAVANTLVLMTCVLLVLMAMTSGVGADGRGSIVQLWGVPAKSGGVRIGANNINAPSDSYRVVIEQEGRLISQQEFNMPAGGSRVFEIKKTATFTTRSPITATLADLRGEVATRTVSVWMNR